MVIFRENAEDIYAGIGRKAGQRRSQEGDRLPANKDGRRKIASPEVLRHRHQAHVQGRYRASGPLPPSVCHRQRRDSGDLVHKGNIMKFTENYLQKLGLCLAQKGGDAQLIDGGLVLLQGAEDQQDHRRQGRHRRCLPATESCCVPAGYDVIACMNLNGDHISDALAHKLAASASHRAPTSATAWPCSKPPTAPRRSTPGRDKGEPGLPSSSPPR